MKKLSKLSNLQKFVPYLLTKQARKKVKGGHGDSDQETNSIVSEDLIIE